MAQKPMIDSSATRERNDQLKSMKTQLVVLRDDLMDRLADVHKACVNGQDYAPAFAMLMSDYATYRGILAAFEDIDGVL